ncbi:MAG: hypothetical protein KJ600_03245 [Nanoarchaeota archaeon]|nr:hypothetical protein [Nanoarchaeota archaeon]MBU1103543.1 hypothetical protein [Nanoarchaeota archaeon]
MGNLDCYCSECADYIPCVDRLGICGRLEDDLAVQVSGSASCVYGSPGERISEDEKHRKKAEAICKHNSFQAHLLRVSEEVSTWPEWERKILG